MNLLELPAYFADTKALLDKWELYIRLTAGIRISDAILIGEDDLRMTT